MLVRPQRKTSSVLLLAAATAAGGTPIALSTLVFEPLADVRDLVTNILKFTEPSTTLVLHLNARQHYRDTDLAVLRAMGGGNATSRVLVNPERLAVTWGDGQCQAFLSNANHYARMRPPRDGVDPIVVWLDSNMMFFRPCVERYLRRARCTRYDRPKNEVPWKAGPNSARKFLTRNGSSPVVMADHEGSFFPLSMLLEMKGGLTTRGGAMPRFARWAENLIFSTYSLSAIPTAPAPGSRGGARPNPAIGSTRRSSSTRARTSSRTSACRGPSRSRRASWALRSTACAATGLGISIETAPQPRAASLSSFRGGRATNPKVNQ